MLHVEAIGLGLLAAGMVLFAFAFLGAYLRAGVDGLIDAVNPLLPASYLPLLAPTSEEGIVEALEGALNTIEDISDVVESIVLKHA